MSRAAKALLVAGALGVAIALFLVLRPDDDEPGAPRPESTAATSIETETETNEVTVTAEQPGPRRIRVTFRNGEVVGGIRRVSADRGERLLLVVRSDVADHVHVHGYDLMEDVGPGAPARIAFRARLVGRFEVELEDRHLPLAEIEVRP